MSDLVERLRECQPPVLEDSEMCKQAADEIERQAKRIAEIEAERVQLRAIVQVVAPHTLARIDEAALRESKP